MGPHPGSEGRVAPWRSRLLRIADLALSATAATVVAAAVLWLTLPDPLPLADRWPETTSYIELRRDQARATGRELVLQWEPVPLSRVPDHLQRAVRVAEDAAFYRHRGVDWHELRAALREWWTDEERLRGASTITMQLARNLHLSPDRSYLRKLREVLLAWRMEARLPKRRILELYLSTVELGPGVFGVSAAARHYWGIPLAGIDRRRAAELAATLPSPLADNPRTRTRRFLWRADLIRRRAFGPDTTSADTLPGVTLPADTVPVDTVLVDTVPTDSVPTDSTAADAVPPLAP